MSERRRTVGGYVSSGRKASDLAPPPLGPAPGATREALEAENAQLREALTLIHEGLLSSLGHGIGTSPSMTLSLESIARHALREDPS